MAALDLDMSDRRQITVRKVMRILLEQGPTSRAEISRQCGLSKQATSETMRLLEQSGFVQAGDVSRGAIGRRPLNYKISSGAACALAIDVGGTILEGLVLDLSGAVLARGMTETSKDGGLSVVKQIVQQANDLMVEAGSSRASLRSVVIGVPGAPERKNGTVRLASNIRGWDEIDVRKALEDGISENVVLENDVKLAALGELQFGAGKELQDFGFLNLGTGVGLGIILGRSLLRGPTGAAGEIGFLPLAPEFGTYKDVREGQFERAVGGRGLANRYNERSDRKVREAREIFERAEAGEATALRLVEESASLIATAILCVRACVDIRHYVLGGSIGGRELLIGKIQDALDRQGVPEITLHASHLKKGASSVGAAHLALERMLEGIFGFESAGEPPPSFSLDAELIARKKFV